MAKEETVARDRPTILQIVPQLDTGGAELSAIEIVEAVVRAGGRALLLAEPGGRLAQVGDAPPVGTAADNHELRLLFVHPMNPSVVSRKCHHRLWRAPSWHLRD